MDLARTQLFSLITKGITTALGIIQSIIVLRVLSPAEFGLVGLVMSIGGVVGVTQHLGIVDGAIREIAVRKNKAEIGKVFWVSHLTRQVVTIPISLLLVLLASVIATHIYHRPEIAFLIQIFAASLILQGLQDVLGATLTGLKRFVSLYAVQIVTAAINVAVFGYLTWRFGMAGFFWAVIITTSVMVGLLLWLAWRALRHSLRWPAWTDIKRYGRQVMKIGVFMYVSRIFFVVWQRLPLLLLGGVLTADQLGYLNVSLTFGSRLTIIAMALSEVNLAWMSSLYATQKRDFIRIVTHNMHRVLVVMMLATLVLLFFAPEILQYIIGAQYLPAERLILVMTLAFYLYALTDIGTSSVFVPADQPKLRALVYGFMTAITAAVVGTLLWLRPDPLLAAFAVLGGALVAYVSMAWLAWHRFHINFLTPQLMTFLMALFAGTAWLFAEPNFISRAIVFALLVGYMLWESRRHKLLPVMWKSAAKAHQQARLRVICFAGAPYQAPHWTNRQHVMSLLSQQYPVLYIEPRVWLPRQLFGNWRHPRSIFEFLGRLLWYAKASSQLYVKAQWNLIPGSREFKGIATVNHYLNRYCVLLTAWWLGFGRDDSVVWLYDTEAAEYLSAFPAATVVYDCVDDHAAQAGVDRNPRRVAEEEKVILKRANLVTATSRRLYEVKRKQNANTHLVLNAGDVRLFQRTTIKPAPELSGLSRPILGTVGALDSYKIDFDTVYAAATARPGWQFVFVGSPILDRAFPAIDRLAQLPNVHFLGAVAHKRVPEFVAGFDVCLIPYVGSRYNQASFPLKFWEFMASGKPIVAMGLPELAAYQPMIQYADTPSQFIARIEQALMAPTVGGAQRMALAKHYSWEKRVERLLTVLHATVDVKSKRHEHRV